MRYLLFPDEERALLRYLAVELGLVALSPVSDDPAALISVDFPWHALVQRGDPRVAEIVFWVPDVGPVRRLGDAPPPTSAVEAVMLQVNRERSPEWRSFVDLGRTPVLSWRRPTWYRRNRSCVVPGRLGSMAARLNTYPPPLRALYGKVERWLRNRGTKLCALDHCDPSQLPVPMPRNRRLFLVTAWPEGAAWLANGGQLWPWDG